MCLGTLYEDDSHLHFACVLQGEIVIDQINADLKWVSVLVNIRGLYTTKCVDSPEFYVTKSQKLKMWM